MTLCTGFQECRAGEYECRQYQDRDAIEYQVNSGRVNINIP